MKFTGTLWHYPGAAYLDELTVTDVSGTLITDTSGTIAKFPINLEKVWIEAEDYDVTANILRFRLYNNLTYILSYKYLLTLRYYNVL